MKEPELHIIHNGEIFLAQEPIVTANNRAFCYGDAVFESMHAIGSEIQFENDHFERLFRALQAYKMKPDFNQAKIVKDIHRLINRDKLFGGVRIRLTVYRQANGLYTPDSHSCGYIIACQTLEKPEYIFNSKGLHIGVFQEMKKSPHALSAFKTANSAINVMAGIYARENQWDDCLLINEYQHIIEGFHSNLFLVKNNILFTPSVSQGCVDGIMRKQIVSFAPSLGFKISENISITENHLLEADEIFFTNAIEGIRWILAYKNRRYFNRTSKLLNDKLNEMVLSK